MIHLRHIVSRLFILVLLAWCAALPALGQSQNSSIAGEGLQNPLKFPNMQKFIEGVLQSIVMIALPIITIFIVYSGFLFISARGNEAKLSNAKNNFTYVIIGTILILSAWVLATLIGGTVSQLLG
jgi:hypothetical protein